MEAIRRPARHLLGYDSTPYRTAAAALDFLSVLRSDGISTWRTLRRLHNGEGKETAVKFRRLLHPFTLRPNTQDALTIINNVCREEYGKFKPTRAPRYMIDAGAYIGDTAAYFLSRFPGLKVVALEPSVRSFELAQRNLQPYGERAVVLSAALWARDEALNFGGGGVTGSSVREEGEEVEGVSVPTLMRRYSMPRLDILKMDIEGAEEQIFAGDVSWLGLVDVLMVEIHSESALAVVRSALRRQGFSMRQYRSIWYCARQ